MASNSIAGARNYGWNSNTIATTVRRYQAANPEDYESIEFDAFCYCLRIVPKESWGQLDKWKWHSIHAGRRALSGARRKRRWERSRDSNMRTIRERPFPP